MRTVRAGHSPDPDDAFMFYALATGQVEVPGVRLELVREDLEALNRRARAGDLEVTALSAAAYTLVADRYRLLDAGGALATGPGPVLVAAAPLDPRDIAERVVAIPGSHTTSALLLRIYCGDPALIEVAFDRIPTVVREGQADLGLLIHEGAMTYARLGLVKVVDLGAAWARDTGLPLPLGVTVARRDLGEALGASLTQGLRESIAWARAHEDEALGHAMAFGRGMDRETCRRFVATYVNEYALSLGEAGRAALTRLFAMARERGLIAEAPPVDPI